MTETIGIRESVLSYTTTRPRSAERIFGLVRQEWGEIGERRLWRILEWLIGRGAVRRIGDRYHGEGYVLGAAVPLESKRSRSTCGVCGDRGHHSRDGRCTSLSRPAAEEHW